MKKTLKLRKLTILMLFAGLSRFVIAGDENRVTITDEPMTTYRVDCDDLQCEVDGNALFKVKPRSYIDDKQWSLQTTSRRDNIHLPNNGMIWVSEDFNMGEPELSISSPAYVPFSQGLITKPIGFYVHSNYSAFVSRYEISVYRGVDTDLVTPIAVIPLDVKAISSVEWSAQLPDDYRFRLDDELIYVLRAYNENGQFDETYPRKIRLVTPEENERAVTKLRDSTSKAVGRVMTHDEVVEQSLISSVISTNNLYRQNISFHGSKVRIQGINIPDGKLYIDGESYPIDQERKFSAEFLLPIGEHKFNIRLDKNGVTENEVAKDQVSTPIDEDLSINITGSSLFLMGLADITLYQNKTTGSGKNLATSGSDDSILSDGRLAFYLKNKINGRYTITSQADTTERELKHLFSGFSHTYPDDIFRQLDPNYYYPTYGDDSSVYRDIDTMGRFYLRMSWDKSQALYGNYNTNILDTKYAKYTRSLYGATLNWRSQNNNQWGDASSQVRIFGSEAQSAPGHTEFLGTGGSLYYLKHVNILTGSDKVRLEVKDKLTQRIETIITLVRGVDYEIDTIQGRIILTTPLTQLAGQNMPSISHENPMNGYEQRLVVDYEWIPSDFDTASITAGTRAKHWFNDYLAIGGTYVDENQSGKDYTLKGTDITLKAGNGTYLKAEYTKTQSTASAIYYSDNGGLSFTQQNSQLPERLGAARAVEGRINFKELALTSKDIQLGAWWNDVDKGYSTSSSDAGENIIEYGSEVSAQLQKDIALYAKHTNAQQGYNLYRQTQATASWRYDNLSTLVGEIKHIEKQGISQNAKGTLGALQYRIKATDSLELSTTGQLTIDNDDGAYENNDALTIGAQYLYGNSSLGLSGTTGARGNNLLLNAQHRLNNDHTIYSNYSFAQSRSDYDSIFNHSQNRNWTIGQRMRLTERLNMFNEAQVLKGEGSGGTGTAKTVGLDYLLDSGVVSTVTVQQGKLASYRDGGNVRRSAVSMSLSKTDEVLDWSSKLEYRRDSGAEQRRQWVSTNRISQKSSEDLRLSSKFNFSETNDYSNSYNNARFIESVLGFAYRPHDNNKWALFGRYNYFYNLSPSEQENDASLYDQKSHIFSFEGTYKYNKELEFASRIAQRKGEVRFGRQTGQWFDSTATILALQARYDIYQQWHAMAEYRQLQVKSDSVKQGWLVGINRDITPNLRFGVGYNLTDFSDDLRKFDYKYQGFFINLVGYY